MLVHSNQVGSSPLTSNATVLHFSFRESSLAKSPAYVVGEKILKPLIDQGAYLGLKLFRIVARGVQGLEQRVNALFRFLPVAEAAPTHNPVQQTLKSVFQRKTSLPSEIYYILEQIGYKDGIYKNYVEKLSEVEQRDFANNEKLRANFLRFSRTVDELAWYIHKKSQIFDDELETKLVHACRNLKRIEETINEMKNDLGERYFDSLYAISTDQVKIIALDFPYYKKETLQMFTLDYIDYQPRIALILPGGFFSPTVTHLVRPAALYSIQMRCYPLEDALLELMKELIPHLTLWRPNSKFTYAHFKALLADDVITYLEAYIETSKQVFENKIKMMYPHLSQLMQTHLLNLKEGVENSIHKFFLLSTAFIPFASPDYEIKVTKQSIEGLVVSWEIYYKKGLIFRFRFGDPYPKDKDEM